MKKIVLFFLVVLILSCSKQDKNKIPEEIQTLNIYAVDVFLNEDFYENIIPIFTKIFKCEVNVIKFPNALSMLETAILERDSTDIDLLFGIDNTLLFLAGKDSLFIQYESKNLHYIHEDLIFEPTCFKSDILIQSIQLALVIVLISEIIVLIIWIYPDKPITDILDHYSGIDW